ncbi:Uncharacterised protein [Acinetobacter baumannii]|nr:Uncharacterised protein [Acinetobacter baumannii]
MGQASWRVYHFHYLFKRQILMLLRSKHPVTHLLQQGCRIQFLGQINTDRQRIHKEADQCFCFMAPPVGARGTDHQI